MVGVFVPLPDLGVQDTSLIMCKDLINAYNSMEDRQTPLWAPEHQ